MKREIKFKVWDKERETMICWQDLVASDYVMYDFDNDNLVWMQYTGLNDCNGEEIYEYDILEVAVGFSGPPVTGVVTYEDTAILCLNQSEEDDVLHYDNNLIEVTGNALEQL